MSAAPPKPPRPSAPSKPPSSRKTPSAPPAPEFDGSMAGVHRIDGVDAEEDYDLEPMPDDTTSRIAPKLGTEAGMLARSARNLPVGPSTQARPGSMPPPLPGASPPNEDLVIVHVRRVGQIKVPMPTYQSPLAAGMDLVAAIEGPLTIAPLARVLVPTGIAMALPPGYEAQIRPRSGLAWSRGLTILNSPGTIDADYRGEIKVLLVNLGTDSADVMPGERIAQMVVARHARAKLEVVEALDHTRRGSGGYGSTGY